MKLLIEDREYELVEIQYPDYMVYGKELKDFRHIKYSEMEPRFQYKSLIINGKFYAPKELLNVKEI